MYQVKHNSINLIRLLEGLNEITCIKSLEDWHMLSTQHIVATISIFFNSTTVYRCRLCVSYSARRSLYTLSSSPQPLKKSSIIPTLQMRTLRLQGLILPKDTQLINGQHRVWTQIRLIPDCTFPHQDVFNSWFAAVKIRQKVQSNDV